MILLLVLLLVSECGCFCLFRMPNTVIRSRLSHVSGSMHTAVVLRQKAFGGVVSTLAEAGRVQQMGLMSVMDGSSVSESFDWLLTQLANSVKTMQKTANTVTNYRPMGKFVRPENGTQSPASIEKPSAPSPSGASDPFFEQLLNAFESTAQRIVEKSKVGSATASVSIEALSKAYLDAIEILRNRHGGQGASGAASEGKCRELLGAVFAQAVKTIVADCEHNGGVSLRRKLAEPHGGVATTDLGGVAGPSGVQPGGVPGVGRSGGNHAACSQTRGTAAPIAASAVVPTTPAIPFTPSTSSAVRSVRDAYASSVSAEYGALAQGYRPHLQQHRGQELDTEQKQAAAYQRCGVGGGVEGMSGVEPNTSPSRSAQQAAAQRPLRLVREGDRYVYK